MFNCQINIWLPQATISKLIEIANFSYPNETGGSLMGYINKDNLDIAVTDIINPGPKAVHKRYSFVPDYNFQEKKIKSIYFKSKRYHTYLGDWHTHPDGSSSLSNTDIKVLKNISEYAPARMPFPIMILLSGNKNKWKIKTWQLRDRKILKIITIKNLVQLNNIIY